MTPEQLKASILQRAMEGKLVPQDPNDEPASELLKRIKAEKEKLIKEGKIKRDKNETEIFRGDDGLHYEKFQDGSVKQTDVPYEIPESWEWVSLNSVSQKITDGSHNPPPNAGFGIQIISAKNIIDGKIDFSLSQRFLTKEEFMKEDSRTEIRAGDILLSIVGSIGKVALAPENIDFTAQRSVSVIKTLLIDNTYLSLVFSSPYFQATLIKKSSGTAQKGIYLGELKQILIPLPPLTEQLKIVDKFNMLLEKYSLYNSLYLSLMNLNLDFPEKLRKSILQYAMQGKLVPQDATDEPVEVLLEKIREEKQRLFKEGKLKKKDLQESIVYQGDDNSYYEKKSKELLQLEKIPSIPLTWKYLRFHQIANYYMGKTPPRSISTFWGNDIPWVSIADMVSDGVIYSTKEALSNTFKANIQEKISPPNTLLMSFKLTVGKVSLLGIEAAHNEAIISIFPYVDTNEIMKMYLFKFLPEIVKYGDSKDAIKGKTLNSKSINALLIPLPPLEEQKRIVDRIEKLDLSVAKLNFIQNKN